ncbi:MAG TPA: NDMA-dependent alcohol dehydrogenase [Pseudonocardia sp.]|uniref:NDMA-dependent alcohol dehydrogenase n=1 Tax=Pseudonocardia sp. TaxID=60912 RepID=UPI002B4B9481|nr:NDMA-dependent alcohol dehydrogenase [Pseudonocardia sp.]HLU55385.1 NDMA-dependent alcohol dehydrogenase [Pseudonocardia sp.]
MQTVGALLWEPGTRSGWSVEEIELDPPKANEVLVKLTSSGICHSDDHLDTGDIPLDWAPILGGHEGAGVVVEVGPEVHDLREGDHVVLSFLPSCGTCRMCVSGRANMCDLGAGVLAGRAPDGTHRIHARGKGVGAMSYLGTFAPYVVAPAAATVRIDPEIPLMPASLIGCGVPTGWGSSVYAADMQLGDTVVVFGTGGVGMNAVQGAVHRGAKNIVAVDPVAFKRDTAKEFGATHAVATHAEAASLVEQMTNGQGADRVIITVDVARGEIVEQANQLTRRGGVIVLTAAAPVQQRDVQFDLFTFAMSGKRLQGSLYGTTRSRNDIPLLADLYKRGRLKLDELITKTYRLEDINEAFADLRDGKNLRGVIVYEGFRP